MLSVLKSSIPYVAHVSNRQPAVGGRDAQSLEDAKLRAPQTLRTRWRAVTADDYEQLAREVNGVARARCIAPGAQPGNGERRVPARCRWWSCRAGRTSKAICRPIELNLSAELRAGVLTHLEERRLVGTTLDVIQPQFIFVSIEAQVRVAERSDPAVLAETQLQAEAALYRYLNPYTGGPRRRLAFRARSARFGDLRRAATRRGRRVCRGSARRRRRSWQQRRATARPAAFATAPARHHLLRPPHRDGAVMGTMTHPPGVLGTDSRHWHALRMSANQPQLIVALEGNVVQTLALSMSTLTIGRTPDNGLSLPHPNVSRRHAELRLTPSGLALTDTGSSNGTFVNGQQLLPQQPRVLPNGATFDIGPFTMTYHGGVAATAGAADVLAEGEQPAVAPRPMAAPIVAPVRRPPRRRRPRRRAPRIRLSRCVCAPATTCATCR